MIPEFPDPPSKVPKSIDRLIPDHERSDQWDVRHCGPVQHRLSHDHAINHWEAINGSA